MSCSKIFGLIYIQSRLDSEKLFQAWQLSIGQNSSSTGKNLALDTVRRKNTYKRKSDRLGELRRTPFILLQWYTLEGFKQQMMK